MRFAVPEGTTKISVGGNNEFYVEHGHIDAPEIFTRDLLAHGCKIGHEGPIEIVFDKQLREANIAIKDAERHHEITIKSGVGDPSMTQKNIDDATFHRDAIIARKADLGQIDKPVEEELPALPTSKRPGRRSGLQFDND
jgi:hypothetical protein